jgi:hypothetical protein
LLLFLPKKFQSLFTFPLLIFDAAFHLIRIKTTAGLVAIMLLFLDSHEVLLRDQNVRTLLLLVVELLDKLAIGLVEVLFLLWIDMSCFTLPYGVVIGFRLWLVSLGIEATWGGCEVHTSFHTLRQQSLRGSSL